MTPPVEVARDLALADTVPPEVGTTASHAATTPTTESSQITQSPRARVAVRTAE